MDPLHVQIMTNLIFLWLRVGAKKGTCGMFWRFQPGILRKIQISIFLKTRWILFNDSGAYIGHLALKDMTTDKEDAVDHFLPFGRLSLTRLGDLKRKLIK